MKLLLHPPDAEILYAVCSFLLVMLSVRIACSEGVAPWLRFVIILLGSACGVALSFQADANFEITMLITGIMLLLYGLRLILKLPLGKYQLLEYVEDRFDYPYRWYFVFTGIVSLGVWGIYLIR